MQRQARSMLAKDYHHLILPKLCRHEEELNHNRRSIEYVLTSPGEGSYEEELDSLNGKRSGIGSRRDVDNEEDCNKRSSHSPKRYNHINLIKFRKRMEQQNKDEIEKASNDIEHRKRIFLNKNKDTSIIHSLREKPNEKIKFNTLEAEIT